MKKAKTEFFILLRDMEQSRFAFTGPIPYHLLNDWCAAADRSEKHLQIQEMRSEDVAPTRQHLINAGSQEFEVAELIDPPVDRSAYYSGKLPAYAAHADRSRVVSILCRNCRANRWAVLNKPYPGEQQLKASGMFDFRADCLRCGYQASDNYNWQRN